MNSGIADGRLKSGSDRLEYTCYNERTSLRRSRYKKSIVGSISVAHTTAFT